MAWAQTQRIRFIEERLAHVGSLNRRDLTSKFGISTAQAAIDIRTFIETHPGRMYYDVKRKAYVSSTAPAASPESDLLKAAKEVLAALIEDFGDPDDQMGDVESVGGGLKEDGSPDPMAITFAHIINLRAAIQSAEGDKP